MRIRHLLARKWTWLCFWRRIHSKWILIYVKSSTSIKMKLSALGDSKYSWEFFMNIVFESHSFLLSINCLKEAANLSWIFNALAFSIFRHNIYEPFKWRIYAFRLLIFTQRSAINVMFMNTKITVWNNKNCQRQSFERKTHNICTWKALL